MPSRNVPFPPMEAQLVPEIPEGNWLYEPKWDGFEHGGTHGSPVGPLLRVGVATNACLGSRRAKPGFARVREATLHAGRAV